LSFQFHLGEHSGFQKQAGIVELHADLGSPGLGIKRGIHVCHATKKLLARKRVDAGNGFLPELDERHVLLVNLRLEPNDGEIGEAVEIHARLEHHTFHCRLLDYNPVGG